MIADLWASEKPPTTEAPRPNPCMVIPMMMVTRDFLNGKYLKGPKLKMILDQKSIKITFIMNYTICH